MALLLDREPPFNKPNPSTTAEFFLNFIFYFLSHKGDSMVFNAMDMTVPRSALKKANRDSCFTVLESSLYVQISLHRQPKHWFSFMLLTLAHKLDVCYCLRSSRICFKKLVDFRPLLLQPKPFGLWKQPLQSICG